MTARRDNVEYHQGAKAFNEGLAETVCTYKLDGSNTDSRRARWALGYAEAKAMAEQGKRMARDYQGTPRPMPKPAHSKLIGTYSEGLIELYKTGTSFAVVYGLQMKQGLSYASAASELGYCILHALNCEGEL